MKIYVAGKVSDIERVNSVQERLRSLGHTITMDWTKFDVRMNSSNFTCDELSKFRGECGERDINGVINADLLLVLMFDPCYAYRGTFCEIGCGLGLKKEIIIICPVDNNTYYCETNCFYNHPSIKHLKSIDEGIELIQIMSGA